MSRYPVRPRLGRLLVIPRPGRDLLQRAGRYSVEGFSPMTCLITIARNRANDQLRARQGIALDAIPEPPDVLQVKP